MLKVCREGFVSIKHHPKIPTASTTSVPSPSAWIEDSPQGIFYPPPLLPRLCEVMNYWMELSVQFRMMMMMEGQCRWQRGRVPSTGAGQGAKGHVQGDPYPAPQCLCPSIRAWSITCLAQGGSNPPQRKPREINTPSTGRGGKLLTPWIPIECPGVRPSWPCLVGNLDWLSWINQVFLGASQGNRLGVGMEKASEDRDPEKVVTECSLQTISQTLLLAALKQPVIMGLWGLQ